MAQLSKKEMTIGQILNTSWRFFWDNWKPIALITIIVYIPLNIFLGIGGWFLVPAEGPEVLDGMINFMRLNSMLELLLGVVATMAIAWLVKARIDKKKITFGEALKKSMSKWPAAIITTIVMGILVGLLTLLFIIPGLIFAIFWIFTIYVILFEDKWLFRAFKGSKEIVRGRWWKVLGFTIVFGVLSFIVSFVAGLPSILVGLIPNDIVVLVLGVFTDTLIDLSVAYFTVVAAIFYLNMRDTKLVPKSK